jgi:hypothetical protein
MNGESPLDPIEGRLRGEAEQLLRLHGREPPTQALVAEHRHRVRRRRVVRWACCVVGLLTAIGAADVAWRHWPGQPAAGGQRLAEAGREAVERALPPEKTRPADGAGTVGPGLPTPEERRPEIASDPTAAPNGPLALPILFTVREGDRRKVVAAGLYLPERAEEVSLLDLSPAEQHAVRQVLGLPEDATAPGPI